MAMLGAKCSPCCKPPDDPPPPPQLCGCKTLPLPGTVTVSLSGFDETLLSDPLVHIQFSAEYGGGAYAIAATPIGKLLPGNKAEGRGPIGSATLLNPGSGYAKLGRVEPTITASVPSVEDAAATVTLTEFKDSFGLPAWGVSAVSISGGEGFTEGMEISFAASEDDTEVTPAAATITTRLVPTLTTTADGGNGDAVISVTVTQNEGQNTWSVTAVSVSKPGTGYPESGGITFAADEEDAVFEAMPAATFKCEREAPTIELTATGGTGAELTPVLSSALDGQGNTYWTLSSVTIGKAGTAYGKFAQISRTFVDGQEYENDQFNTYIESVNGNGGITAVTVLNGGKMFKNTGNINSVSLTDGGLFYRETGKVQGVNLTNGGEYYRESKDAEPYVAEVTGSVAWQIFPSIGEGATFKAKVNDDPYSAAFGKVSEVNVSAGGKDYLAFIKLETCLTKLNDKEFVLQQTEGNPCQYFYECVSGTGTLESPLDPECAVQYEGLLLSLSPDVAGDAESATLDVNYTRFGPGQTKDESSLRLASDCYPYNCKAMQCVGEEADFTLSRVGGGLADVSAGGEVDLPACFNPSQEIIAGLKITIEYLGRTVVYTPGTEPERCSDADFLLLSPPVSPTDPNCGISAGSQVGFSLAWDECPLLTDDPTGFSLWRFGSVDCSLVVRHDAPECSHWAVGTQFFAQWLQPDIFGARVVEVFIQGFKQLGAVPVDDEGYPDGTVNLYYDGPICVFDNLTFVNRVTCVEGAATTLPEMVFPSEPYPIVPYPTSFTVEALRNMRVTFERTLD